MMRLIGIVLLALFWSASAWAQPMPGGGGSSANLNNSTVVATGSTTNRLLADRLAERFNILDYGAKGNAVAGSDGTVAAGSNAFCSSGTTFSAADVGKAFALLGSGTGGADQKGTIAGFTSTHCVTLSFSAVLGVPYYGVNTTTTQTAQSGAGSYAPGDTLTIAGGTGVTTAATQTVTATQVVAASVAAGGSGGANGAAVVTGTTGTAIFETNGQRMRFSANVTIASGAITAVNSISYPGTYTVNPTSIAAEPVSGAGLVGATLNLKMGVFASVPSAAGIYATLPTSPAATTSATGTGATLNLNPWPANAGQRAGFFVYGADDTAAVNAAIAGANSAGGGSIIFPPSRTLMLGAMVIPYTGTNLPTQNPFRLIGSGGSVDTYLANSGRGQPAPRGGSVLDMLYDGTDGTHVAKIDTRGGGAMEIADLMLADSGGDNALFIQTTNTQLDMHDVQIMGNPGCFRVTCAQDAIRLGGITPASATLGTDAATAGFQGYGTRIAANHFNRINEAIQFGGSANAVYVSGNSVAADSGSADPTGAPFHFYGTGCCSINGNTLIGNTVEMPGYAYCTEFTSNGQTNAMNAVVEQGCYDAESMSASVGGFWFDANSTQNMLRPSYITQIIGANMMDGPGAPLNTLINSWLPAPSQFPWPVAFGQPTGQRKITLNGGGSAAGDGTALYLSNGGAFTNIIGNQSAIYGGTYDPTLILYSPSNGVRIPNGPLTVQPGATNFSGMALGVGDGLGMRKIGLNGSNSGTGGGAFYEILYGGGLGAAVGNYSSIMGGAFDQRLALWAGGQGVVLPSDALTLGAPTGTASGVGGLNIAGQYRINGTDINQATVPQKTANYTLTANDSGSILNNKNAAGEVDFTLPAAVGGFRYCFTVWAAQTVKVIANAVDKIAFGATVGALGGNLTATAPYATTCLYSPGSTLWVVYSTADKTQWTVN